MGAVNNPIQQYRTAAGFGIARGARNWLSIFVYAWQTSRCAGPSPPRSGERFLGDIDLVKLGYTSTEHVAGERATHVVLGRHATGRSHVLADGPERAGTRI